MKGERSLTLRLAHELIPQFHGQVIELAIGDRSNIILQSAVTHPFLIAIHECRPLPGAGGENVSCRQQRLLGQGEFIVGSPEPVLVIVLATPLNFLFLLLLRVEKSVEAHVVELDAEVETARVL